EYFNPGLTIAGGQHAFDTARRWQDHDLTLLPQSPFKLFLGYSRNLQDGPAFTTFNLNGSRGDEFPLFADTRRERNEYRLGGALRYGGAKLTVVRGWENFKEDTPIVLSAPSAGNNTTDTNLLNSLTRNEPYHGNNPNWRITLFTERGRWLSVSGRFTYSGGERSFIVDESFAASRFGTAQSLQTLVFGNGRRPVATGNLTVTLLPTPRLSIANHTAVYNVRTEGNSGFRILRNGSQTSDQAYFQSLGIRTVVNTTDADYSLAKWVHVHGGYQYSIRRIRSREFFAFGSGEEIVDASQNNRVHSGLTGIRFQPLKGLTVGLQGEIGRANRPFFPTSERDYHTLGARVVYQAKTLRLSGLANANYNTNSVSMTSHSSRARNYSFDGAWTPASWFSVDAGYSKLHLDTLSGIAFFVTGFQLLE
ncbi:MAG: hypothetical protein GY953_33815, partial [bacterium]|nr:hypothetical protein [bacterium]